MNMAALTSLREAYTGRLLTEPADTASFLTDWRQKWTGRALAVAQPAATHEVAALLGWSAQQRVPVVPQGGNTGLSGGATPDATGDAIVLSLARMNRVRHIDVANHTMVVEAGATLQQVQAAAHEAGYLFPLSLGAEGTCTIGGNLATNAGGVQVLRYGSMRGLCLGLEVVLPGGDVWHGLRALRKDNSGYALRELFIGSEGTLGVITAAVLTLHPLPTAQSVAFIAVPSPQAAAKLLQLSRSRLDLALTAFELMSDPCIALVEKHVESARLPLQARSAWYVLMELSSVGDAAHLGAALEELLEDAMARQLATDAALSSSLAQFDAMWALREHISVVQGAEGQTIKHDIALPVSHIADFICTTSAALADAFPAQRLFVFGHLGDGNLHYNLLPAEGHAAPSEADSAAQETAINRLVHDAVHAHGGSISAEHGLGVLRRDESARFKSPVEMRLMQAIKLAFDPLLLMNPGKLLLAP